MSAKQRKTPHEVLPLRCPDCGTLLGGIRLYRSTVHSCRLHCDGCHTRWRVTLTPVPKRIRGRRAWVHVLEWAPPG